MLHKMHKMYGASTFIFMYKYFQKFTILQHFLFFFFLLNIDFPTF